MTLDLYTTATLLLLALASGWALHGAAQLCGAWSEAKQRVAVLSETHKREAKALLKQVGEIERLDTEIREGRTLIETTVKATAVQREEMARFKPPTPVDIFATSEFPASKRDRAWVVRMSRDAEDESAGRSARREDCLLLVWAGDNALALNRGRQILGRRGYEPEAVNRLG